MIWGCFQKWGYPQIIHPNRVFHYKPSILRYHYFWKHPWYDMIWYDMIWMIHIGFSKSLKLIPNWCKKFPLNHWCFFPGCFHDWRSNYFRNSGHFCRINSKWHSIIPGLVWSIGEKNTTWDLSAMTFTLISQKLDLNKGCGEGRCLKFQFHVFKRSLNGQITTSPGSWLLSTLNFDSTWFGR